MRINKFLATAGVASRRKSEEFIHLGQVTVNGQIIKNLSTDIDVEKDIVCLKQKRVELKLEKDYILLNKPEGYVCTNQDRHAALKACDLIPQNKRLFHVGRLDKDSTGLILFTNDGALAQKLLHPQYKLEKKYVVKINKPISNEHIFCFKKGGILLEEEKYLTAPAKIKLLDHTGLLIEVILKEGKKRQIRRMFASLGYHVLSLDRVAIGPITAKGLKRGKYRFLTKQEIETLKNA